MSDVVLVLGMHRSGTSAVAGVLTKLGGAPPKTLMPANVGNARGYFESVPFMQFHDEILASGGSNWHDWRAFNSGFYKSPTAAEYRRRAKEIFMTEFDDAPLAVLKDPRMCRIVPFWLEVLRELRAIPHVVIPIRSPIEVAKSLQKLQGIPVANGLLIWLRHVLDAEMQSRAEARSIFTWDAFTSDWRRVCDKISSDTGLSWPRRSDRVSYEIDHFLTKELVHQEISHAELITHSEIHEWTLHAYEALLELARNPFSNSAMDTLDRIRSIFDQSTQLFGRALVDYEVSLEDLKAQTLALTSERELLRIRADEAKAESAAFAVDILARAERAETAHAEAVRDKEALSARLVAVTADHEAMRDAHQQTVSKLQASQQELAGSNGALADFAKLLLQSENALSEVTRERDALSHALATHAQELAESRSALEALRGETDKLSADLIAEREAAAMRTADLLSMDALRIEAERQSEDLTRALDAAQLQERELRHALSELGLSREEANKALELARLEKMEIEAANQNYAASLEQALTEKQELARKLDQITSDLSRVEQAANERVSAQEAAHIKERQDLTSELDHISSSARRMEQAAKERILAQEAAHTKALSKTKTDNDVQIRVLRGQLVDAEAALSQVKSDTARKGAWTRWMPNTVRRRVLARQLIRSGLFDTAWYKTEYPDVELEGLDAAKHYLEIGFCHGYKPNPFFDTRWYLERYADVRHSGMNPLIHYFRHGYKEGRDPGPNFKTDFYLETNPDVRNNGMNPLAHYLRYGQNEGRRPMQTA